MPHIERFPLIFDHHNHLSFSAMLSSFPYVGQYTSKDDMLAYLREHIEPGSALTVVVGLRNEIIKLTETDLRSLPPLVFLNNCLHGYTCSAKAAQLLREASIEPYPQTARQAEKEMAKLFFFFSESLAQCASAESMAPALKCSLAKLQQVGLYGAEDMMYTLPFTYDSSLCPNFIVKTRRPWRENSQSASTTQTIQLSGQAQQEQREGNRSKPMEPPTNLPCLKLFADGALGAGTAALSAGYIQGGQPVLVYEDNELTNITQKCIALEADTAIHAIGDRAIAQVLRVFKSCCPLPTGCRFKLRLEHCQFISLAQARECKKLGLTLCMQPNFSVDSLTYANKLSQAWLQRNNPLRMLIDQVGFMPGQDLLWGSDGMPSGLAPALQSALFPVWPEQALTVEEILAGYSADSAMGYREYIIDWDNRSVTLKQ